MMKILKIYYEWSDIYCVDNWNVINNVRKIKIYDCLSYQVIMYLLSHHFILSNN